MDQAIRILFSHSAATPDQVKHAESQLTAFEASADFWDQTIQMLQNTVDAQIQAYLLMAMKRKINSDTKSFTSSQKRSLLEFINNLSPSPMRVQLLARLYARFWNILVEDEKKSLLHNFSIFYYFLEEDLDVRIVSWLSPITKAELFPQLLSSAPNSERCGIIKLLVEKEIAALEASQVETLLAMAVQSGYPEELFNVLEILLEKYPPATFLPFIKYFLDCGEEEEVALEFILFCTEWLEYASQVELAPVYIKILQLACAHYDPADPCFSPQFLLEVSQLPAPLPLELEEAVVLSASHLLKRIIECEDIEEERREGDLSMVKSAVLPFAKLNYFEHFVRIGDGLMAEAIASHLPSISVFTLKGVLTCDTLSLKEKLRVSNRLLRLLSQSDLELLKEFTLTAFNEQPVISLKLLRHLNKKINIDFVGMYSMVSSIDQRVFKVYVTCLDEYSPQVLEYICQAKDVDLLSSYIENLKQLPLDSLIYLILGDVTFESVHSTILEKLHQDSLKKLFDALLSNPLNSIVLLAKLASKNKSFQSTVLDVIFSVNIHSKTMKLIIPLLRHFDGNVFIAPLISSLSQTDFEDPELLQSLIKLVQTKHTYNTSFATQCLSLTIQDPFTDSLIGSYLYSFYQTDPNTLIQLLKQRSGLQLKPDSFKSESNFIEWWGMRKIN